MAHVLIATPTNGAVKPETTQTIFYIQAQLVAAGHKVDFLYSKGADIVRQRNALASRFVEAPQFSHLLAIDADMDCDPELALRMLVMGKPMVGATYPKKHIDLDRLVTLARSSDDPAPVLIAKAQDYVVRFEGARADIIDGAIIPDGLGFGMVLIERGVFTTMAERGVAKIKRNDTTTRAERLRDGLYNFFDLVYVANGGTDYLTEDMSFCHRWRVGCGGEIWAIIDSDVGHIGDMRFGQPFIASR